MHKRIAGWALLIAAFSMSAAAQVTGTGTSGTLPVFTGTSTLSNSPISVSGSNVGIGTTNPQYAKLQINGLGSNWGSIGFSNSAYATGAAGMGIEGPAGTVITGSALNDFSIFSWSNMNFSANDGSSIQMRILNNGNVGIGTTNPGAKLEVSGNLKLSSGSGASITFQDGTTQSTAFTGVLCGGDYAESVDVTGSRSSYEPGDVLVIDPNAPGKFLKANQTYSTLVAGIYSTKPGTVGRRQTTAKTPDEVPMAMVGIVPTKVSAENGPIRSGDLLVASSTLGRAMKGTDRGLLTGAVIGKALGSLDSGTGVIEVLVTLQ